MAGRGTTCLSMVFVDLTRNTDLDPASMALFSERNGFVESGMTSWLPMSEGAELLGLSSYKAPAQSSSKFNELASGRLSRYRRMDSVSLKRINICFDGLLRFFATS